MSRMFNTSKHQSRNRWNTLGKNQFITLKITVVLHGIGVKTPVSIMHNDADGSVPGIQGIEMFMALKRLESASLVIAITMERNH